MTRKISAVAAPKRCPWALSHPLATVYHDYEWGVPVHDDRHFFEMLLLEGAQAGLNWNTILMKREAYREAFHNFEACVISRYDGQDVRRLLGNSEIVRNRLKITAAIQNAKAFLEVQKEFDSFDAYIWRFVGGRQRNNARKRSRDVPPTVPEAVAMSEDLRRRGFRFVGPTISYAFMQATGMVNDHLVSCFRYEECLRY
jgi:DNA-3-methyladenine glycosylase I